MAETTYVLHMLFERRRKGEPRRIKKATILERCRSRRRAERLYDVHRGLIRDMGWRNEEVSLAGQEIIDQLGLA